MKSETIVIATQMYKELLEIEDKFLKLSKNLKECQCAQRWQDECDCSLYKKEGEEDVS